MASRVVRYLAMGLCAPALALMVSSCSSGKSPTALGTGTGGGGGGSGASGGGSGSASGNVTVDFSACPALGQPVWFAYQDGTGPWTVLTSSSHVYQFDIAQSKGGFAYVTVDSTGQTQTAVDLYLQTQLTLSSPIVFCPATGGTNSMTGTVTGLASNQEAWVSLTDQGLSLISYPETSYTLNNMVAGSFDLVAWKTGAAGPSPSDRVIIRRKVAVKNGGVIPLLDFNSAEAESPATGTITVTNANGAILIAGMQYYTGSSCTYHPLYVMTTPSPFQAYGVPPSLQNASDFHGFGVALRNASGNNLADVFEVFHTMGNRTFTFAPLIQPTISVLSGSYKRLQAVFALPTDYNSDLSMQYKDAGGAHGVSINEPVGYIGGSTVTLAIPDFSTLPGFTATWEPATGATTNWELVVTGGNLQGHTVCQEGLRVVSDDITGTN